MDGWGSSCGSCMSDAHLFDILSRPHTMEVQIKRRKAMRTGGCIFEWKTRFVSWCVYQDFASFPNKLITKPLLKES